jgi:hypothetical protein
VIEFQFFPSIERNKINRTQQFPMGQISSFNGKILGFKFHRLLEKLDIKCTGKMPIVHLYLK